MPGARLHLIKRNSIYYWRRRLPSPLVEHFGKSHLVISTRLTDLLSASRLARRLSVILDRFLAQMESPKRVPTAAEIAQLVREIQSAIEERYELGQAVLADPAHPDPRYVARRSDTFVVAVTCGAFGSLGSETNCTAVPSGVSVDSVIPRPVPAVASASTSPRLP